MTMAEILERHRNGREAQIGDGELLLPYRRNPEGENTPPEQAPDDPSGTPRGITAKARRHTDQAIEVLVSGLQDEDVRIRMAAAKELLDRGWGKTLTMNADLTDRLESFDDQSLDKAIAILRDLVGSAVESGDREEPARIPG